MNGICRQAASSDDITRHQLGPRGVREKESFKSGPLALAKNVNHSNLFDGGRTRARTLDPLIKSQLSAQDEAGQIRPLKPAEPLISLATRRIVL